jgi:hypothetical protein
MILDRLGPRIDAGTAIAERVIAQGGTIRDAIIEAWDVMSRTPLRRGPARHTKYEEAVKLLKAGTTVYRVAKTLQLPTRTVVTWRNEMRAGKIIVR